MGSEKLNVPQRRFKEFENTGAWEQRKLSELTSLITKGTTPLDKSGNGKINYVKIESIDSSSGKITITSTISEEEHNGYLKRSQLQEGDVLFSIAGTLGRVTAVNKDVLPANTNQALAIIRLKNCNLNYIITYLKGKAVSEFVKKNPTVGAQPNLSLEQVGNLEIALPKTDEQEQIGDFFFNLDNLITLHQRKLDKIQSMKKSYLSEMFPAEGETKPKRRFSGFTDDWEQRKLGEIYKFQYGIFNNNPNNGGKYPVYGANGIIGGYTEFNSEDAIIIGHMGEYAGNVLWGDGKHFVTYNGIITAPRDNSVNSRFGYYLLQQKNIRQICGGSGQPFLSYEMLNKLQSCISANLDEQLQIEKFFTNFDNLITLHQRKLEKLKNMKQAYLTEMFV